MNHKALTIGAYHWGTAHLRNRISPHAMDFEHYPLPFKAYGRGSTLPLPGPGQKTGGLSELLSEVLFLSYGVTSVRQTGGIPFLFRPSPSAGGLYPCNLYMAVLGSKEGETGLYYYDPPGHRLIRIRKALNHKTTGGDATKLSDVSAADVGVCFIVTATIYNSTWKYRDRAYRYLLLDSGHLVQNLVRNLVRNLDLNPAAVRVHEDFSDQDLARLLDLDLTWELPMAMVTLSWDKSVSDLVQTLADDTVPDFPEHLIREGEKVYMRDYTLPARAHESGFSIRETRGRPEPSSNPSWRSQPHETLKLSAFFPGAETVFLPPELGDLMRDRRSRRNFTRERVGRADQQRLLRWVLPWLCMAPGTITLAMAVQNFEGLADGIWTLDPARDRLDLVMPGSQGQVLAGICLGQDWVAKAAVTFLVLADLDALEACRGFRGYRYAMILAGRLGQEIYLGAEAAGMGCCGIGAIYDRDAQALLGLDKNTALLYALSAGPVKKKIVR